MNKEHPILSAVWNAIRAIALAAAKTICWLVRCLARFPNATICFVIGFVVTVALHSLPTFISWTWYISAAATIVFLVRGAWLDMTVSASENRIVARMTETISRATRNSEP